VLLAVLLVVPAGIVAQLGETNGNAEGASTAPYGQGTQLTLTDSGAPEDLEGASEPGVSNGQEEQGGSAAQSESEEPYESEGQNLPGLHSEPEAQSETEGQPEPEGQSGPEGQSEPESQGKPEEESPQQGQEEPENEAPLESGTAPQASDTASGSIEGLLWVDGNGMSENSWNGLFDSDESPLGDFPVFLFRIEDPTALITHASVPHRGVLTQQDGTYRFENLEPGNYVVGLMDGFVRSDEYLLPFERTRDNYFEVDWDAIDWSVWDDEIDRLIALTEVIELSEDESIEGINAGMRLPMGAVATAHFVIDLSSPSSGTGYGYSNGVISFSGGTADNHSYTFRQSSSTSPVSTIMFLSTSPQYVELDNINWAGTITMAVDPVHLNLRLRGDNVLRGSLFVTRLSPFSVASLTIDSATHPGTSIGSLTISTTNNQYAAIGGGSGPDMFQECGNITINGGTINATSVEGAAIGGGPEYGSGGIITIQGGAVVNATTTNGAAIGGGARQGNGGTITIQGNAVVNAYTQRGAGIGGGADAGAGGNITIGGNAVVNTFSSFGAGIGGGGNIGGAGGNITITGNAVVTAAGGSNAAGIGGGVGGAGAQLTINSGARIDAYSQSALPAIHAAGAINGTGYFVNAKLDPGYTFDGQLVVFADGDITNALMALQMPEASWRCFAFQVPPSSAGQTNYNVYVDTPLGMQQVLRSQGLPADSPVLYSITALSGYNSHQRTTNLNEGWLPVKLKSAPLYRILTEKYVNLNGTSLMNDNTSVVTDGFMYSKALSSLPSISNYNAVGYKWDSITGPYPMAAPGQYTLGNVPLTQITANRTIYYIYSEPPPNTTLTVTKEVTGDYGQKTKPWIFTVYFRDSSGVPLAQNRPFDYSISGAGILIPVTGTKLLGSSGQLSFELKHGQQIVIQDVPVSCLIRIVETADSGYTTSFIDRANPSNTPVIDHDTGGSSNAIPVMLAMSPSRIFDFTNDCIYVVEAGVGTYDEAALVLAGMLLAVSILIVAYVARSYIRRKDEEGSSSTGATLRARR